jgi:potassium efflux system protein
MRKLLKFKILLSFCLLFISATVWSESLQPMHNFIPDKTSLVSQQIGLLKDRLAQAQHGLTNLQHRQEVELASLSIDRVNKQLLNQAGLDISVAKSNLDSVSIELSESQQTINRLNKESQEVENELNVSNIFGLKVTSNNLPNTSELQSQLHYQKSLIELEKTRVDSLLQLRSLADNTLQLYKARYSRIEGLLKSQTVMQLKEQQAKSELAFQQDQSYWLQRQNNLYAELNHLDAFKQKDKAAYAKIENEIFYANEKVNFSYLQMLMARYQDQIQQLRVSISRSNSITLLNKVGDQTQLLTKQITRVGDLLKNRVKILEKRKALLLQVVPNNADVVPLNELENQYNTAITNTVALNQQLFGFRQVLEQSLKQELSSRQGLPGFGARAWFDVGAELMLVPTLTFHVVKSLSLHVMKAIDAMNYTGWVLIGLLEIIWLGFCFSIKQFMQRAIAGVPDHEFGHINLTWLSIKLLSGTLIDIALIGGVLGLFYFCGIPLQNFSFIMNLAFVWLFFKWLIMAARLCLLETMHNHSGRDVKLFYRLKWSFLIGGVVTALTVFIHQLPVIYEVKDLFVRLFLLFLLIVSVFLLKSWEVLPGLILPHIDERHTYLKRIIRLVGILIPLILLVNSAIGLFGYVNFVFTISWYESIFLMVLVGYLSVRGILNEGMEFASEMMIRHINNGWLWTEAFLKPIDKVLRLILFFTAWVVLFLLYGWDQQSPVVERLTKLLHYHLFDLLNTSITPLSILELFVLVALLYWAARWTREFVYRLLFTRTRDMGIRNSIAILSQYTMIAIGAFICLRVLGIDFRALAVVAGMFSLGIGLGLRDIANNFVCGFILLIERPLRVGDTVTINETEGEVIHIGGRAVTVRTFDHKELLVPNADIFSKTFTNWTGRDNIVRTVVDVKVNRHDRPKDVQALIQNVLNNHKDVLKEPASEVYLIELNDGMIEFEIRYYINLRQVVSRTGVRSEVLMAIWEAFEKDGIKPPYPHHEIYLKGNLPLMPDSSSSRS